MRNNPNSAPNSIDAKLLGTAVDVVNDKAGGKFSMEMLRSQIETAEFKNDLIKRIKKEPDLSAKYPDADSAVNALKTQLDGVQQTLIMKERVIKEGPKVIETRYVNKTPLLSRWYVKWPLIGGLIVGGGFLLWNYLDDFIKWLMKLLENWNRDQAVKLKEARDKQVEVTGKLTETPTLDEYTAKEVKTVTSGPSGVNPLKVSDETAKTLAENAGKAGQALKKAAEAPGFEQLQKGFGVAPNP